MAMAEQPREERRGWVAPEIENFETPMEVTFYSGRA
jgi:hypothetical protein